MPYDLRKANYPPGLRGFLTRWLLEISAGVFIGNPSARIRDALWNEVQQYAGQGRALLVVTVLRQEGADAVGKGRP